LVKADKHAVDLFPKKGKKCPNDVSERTFCLVAGGRSKRNLLRKTQQVTMVEGARPNRNLRSEKWQESAKSLTGIHQYLRKSQKKPQSIQDEADIQPHEDWGYCDGRHRSLVGSLI